jgi:hypothetical protein
MCVHTKERSHGLDKGAARTTKNVGQYTLRGHDEHRRLQRRQQEQRYHRQNTPSWNSVSVVDVRPQQVCHLELAA